MREVTQVQILSGYHLLLTFNNDIKKVVNIEPFIKGPMFQPLKDDAYFKNVTVDREAGTIVWPNEADIDPDVLYDHGVKVKVGKKKQNKQKIYHQQTPTNIWSPSSDQPMKTISLQQTRNDKEKGKH